MIRPLSKNLRQALYERLAAAGVIRAGRGKILGIFPTRTWPAQDASHEAQVRELLTQALVQQTAPDTRTAALIALLHALRCEHKIVDPGPYGLSRRQLAARAEEIAQGNWASGAVRKAIDEMNAAVVAATTAATIATSGYGPYGWAVVPDGAREAGALAVGDAADGEGPGPDSVGDGDGLVGDGVGEWLVCRGVGVGLGVCAGWCVAVGLVAGAGDPVASGSGAPTGRGRTRRGTTRSAPGSTCGDACP